MRLFTSLLLFLAANAFAGFAPGTQALYLLEGNGLDATGTYNMTATGTPAFNTGSCAPTGTKRFGPATDANYWSTPVGLGTVLAAATWNVYESYIYILDQLSPANFQTIAVASATFILRLNTTNTALRWDTTTGIETGSLSINTCYLVDFVGTANSRTIYLNNVAGTPSATNGLFPTNAAVMLGSLHAIGFDGFSFNGYQDNVRFAAGSGAAPTSFPFVDTNNTLRSPYLKNVVRPYLGRGGK